MSEEWRNSEAQVITRGRWTIEVTEPGTYVFVISADGTAVTARKVG